MKSIIKLLALLFLHLPLLAIAQQSNINDVPPIDTQISSCSKNCSCGDNFLPLAINAAHIHNKGEWSIEYDFMNTNMAGMERGSRKVNSSDVYNNYMMSPCNMSMQMHMAMVMYGVTDNVTVMAMTGYMVNTMSMNMDPNMGGMVMPMGNITMSSDGGGMQDTKLSALINVYRTPVHQIIGCLGISLPTGSYRTTGTTILGDGQRLPYNMQAGSGSYGFCPDLTYSGKMGNLLGGANTGADLKLNYNSLGYKVGNAYHTNVWVGRKFFNTVALILRIEDVISNKISGSDPIIANPVYQTSDPTTCPCNYGGNWVNAYLGFNFRLQKPVFDHFQLKAEYGMPVYQNLNGTQMALSNNFYLGLHYSF